MSNKASRVFRYITQVRWSVVENGRGLGVFNHTHENGRQNRALWRKVDKEAECCSHPNMDVEHIRTSVNENTAASALRRFLARPDISARNKELVARYVRDAALGMTVKGKAKTRIGPARRTGYITTLLCLIDYLHMDLDRLTIPDMQRFVEALEGGHIKSRRLSRRGRDSYVDGKALSPRYIVDIKTNIRRYYKYLLGNCTTYPPLVDWLDVVRPRKEVTALTELEVQKLVDAARCVRDRALIQVFFDSGFRLGELLNVRLQNVSYREVEGGHKCYFVRAPYSSPGCGRNADGWRTERHELRWASPTDGLQRPRGRGVATWTFRPISRVSRNPSADRMGFHSAQMVTTIALPFIGAVITRRLAPATSS